MTMATSLDTDRFSVSNFDRSEIVRIQRETGLDPKHAQLIYEYRWKAARNLYENERTLCKELERQLARKKAEAANPLRRANGNDGYERADLRREPLTSKTSEAAPPPELVRLDLAQYDTVPIPEREWGVRDRFPRRAVALLSGEGAVGKSLLLLQLSAAHVTGRDWLRSMPEQ